jgi:hypothetical protein
MASNDDRFKRAIAAIDAANSADPNHESFAGKDYPKELLYSRRQIVNFPQPQASRTHLLLPPLRLLCVSASLRLCASA